MKIVTLHCDYIRYQALKKAVKDAEALEDKNLVEVDEPLVVLTAVEKGDTPDTIEELVKAVEKTSESVKTKNMVLYPYAHLSSNLASPKLALDLLKDAEKKLKLKFDKVKRAPFGYYKSFELKVKGHPLSELSKEFKSNDEPTPGNVVEEEYDIKNLLRQISKSRLDTSKLKDHDHRIIGQKLDLFSFNEAAPGMIFWHDSGHFIYREVIRYIRALLKKYDYQEISTPQILDSKLFKVSGHWKHFRNNMFLTEYEGRPFGIKPMNCPGGMLVYRTRPRSYKELPLRLAEFGDDHRRELSGVLSGLFRLIRFTQDDAHVFCTKEQIGKEIEHMLEFIRILYKENFGFEYTLELSTRPEKYMGDKKDWDDAEETLKKVLKKSKAKYKINEGDGAFYGPKIDLHVKDSLKREWQCATIQLDMQMPKRFELEYIDEDNSRKTPFVIHRAMCGAVERFIGVLLEHLNGNLPLWLSPRQVRVISFTDKNRKACETLVGKLRKKIPDLRVDADLRSDTVQSRIRDAELLKINYIIVIGDKEEKAKTLAVRPRGSKPKFGVKTETFLKEVEKELKAPYQTLVDYK